MDQPFVANLLVSLVLLVRTLFKGVGFPVDVYERVYILLAFHGAFTPGSDSTPEWCNAPCPGVGALNTTLTTDQPQLEWANQLEAKRLALEEREDEES